MSERGPTVWDMWSSAAGLLALSLLIFIVVSIGAVCMMAIWVVTLPSRLLARGR